MDSVGDFEGFPWSGDVTDAYMHLTFVTLSSIFIVGDSDAVLYRFGIGIWMSLFFRAP